jgi:hypothetical protein
VTSVPFAGLQFSVQHRGQNMDMLCVGAMCCEAQEGDPKRQREKENARERHKETERDKGN